ncbi:MAG TPA: FAD-dependent oxidoreductase [Mariprofundaceae bacterium]|nr:FAD-dependent oxidoreductase [Mariprofundaceae bacterium]
MEQSNAKRVAVVGGGIAGLTAALRLAESGYQVDLFEAAPALGGRTKSFYDEEVDEWVDNGPHVMVGAYHATLKLLGDVNALQHVRWQSSLTLSLWDKERGLFDLKAVSWLPVNIALIWAAYRLPEHGLSSVKAMLRLAMTMVNRDEEQTVQQWMDEMKAPKRLIEDMLEVLCLGVMNEPMQTANAKTFARVLATSFSSHKNAKMGWFNKPLSQALVAPIADKLRSLGVNMELRHSVRNLGELNHDAVVLALPAFARNRLLGINEEVETQAITNIHLWFEERIALPNMMQGMLGTYGQWLFDVSAMMKKQGGLQHLCVIISADESDLPQQTLIDLALKEIEMMLGKKLPEPKKVRFIREKRATVLVRNTGSVDLPSHVFDAVEAPSSGQLPATIELAVISGEKAARLVHLSHKINT